jgi:hypothetical protein
MSPLQISIQAFAAVVVVVAVASTQVAGAKSYPSKTFDYCIIGAG